MSRADELRAQLAVIEAEEAKVEAVRAAKAAYLADKTNPEAKAAFHAAKVDLATHQAENLSVQGQSVNIDAAPVSVSSVTPEV